MEINIDNLRAILQTTKVEGKVCIKIGDDIYELDPRQLNMALTSETPQVFLDSFPSVGQGEVDQEDFGFLDQLLDNFGIRKVSGTKSKILDLNNREQVIEQLVVLLEKLQQLNCKLISKAWVRRAVPKKQSIYPYTGGDLTKPSWWPYSARHKEPDHLKKHERISVMLSILLTPNLLPCSEMRLATQEVMSNMSQDRVPYLNEIFLIKSHIEQGSSSVEVSDFALSEGLSNINFKLELDSQQQLQAEIEKAISTKPQRIVSESFSPNIENYSLPNKRVIRRRVNREAPRTPLKQKSTNTSMITGNNGLFSNVSSTDDKSHSITTNSSLQLTPQQILSNSTPSTSLESVAYQPDSSPFLPPLKMMHIKSDKEVQRVSHGRIRKGKIPVFLSDSDSES